MLAGPDRGLMLAGETIEVSAVRHKAKGSVDNQAEC